MRILFDHDVPRPLRRHLPGHEVDTARQRGWEELRNGDLLDEAEQEGYEVFITADQKIPYQQNLDRRPFGVVVLLSNNWPQVRENTTAVQSALEPVYNLFRISTAKARTTICRLVLSFLSQFFQRRRHFSSQPKDRSTTHRFGSTTKVCSSLRFTTSTEAPSRLCTAVAKGFPVYPPSTSTFCTWLRLARRRSNIAKAPARSVTLAVVT